MAPEKQRMRNFFPFSTNGEVLKTGSTQEVLERVVAVVSSSTSICVEMFSRKPISVCTFFNHKKEGFTLKC